MAYEKRRAGGRPGLVFGLVFGIFALVGTIFLAVGWFSWAEGQRFAAEGVTTMGVVEKTWESQHDCRDDDSGTTRKCTDFNVGYSYVVEGRSYQASGTTGYDQWASLSEGAEIKLRYLPSDPESVATSFSRDEVSDTGGMGVLALVFGGMGGLFAAIGWGGVAWLVLRARAAAWMRQNGVKRGAVVVTQEETSVTVNDRRMWRITWTDDTGARGQSRGRAREDLPGVGTRISIFADPQGKREAIWEGDA